VNGKFLRSLLRGLEKERAQRTRRRARYWAFVPDVVGGARGIGIGLQKLLQESIDARVPLAFLVRPLGDEIRRRFLRLDPGCIQHVELAFVHVELGANDKRDVARCNVSARILQETVLRTCLVIPK